MGRLKTQQGRTLWTKTIIQYVGVMLLYTFAFAVFTFAIGLNALVSLGDWIADETSQWSYVSIDEFDALVDNKDIRTQDLQIMGLPGGLIMDYEDWESYGRGLCNESAATAGHDEIKILQENGEITVEGVDEKGAPVVAFRDLRVYNTLRDLKWLFVIAAYVIGLLVASLFMLRKSVRSIDAVTSAISSPGLPKGDDITLPASLASVQSEIEMLQMRIVQNEMAARIADERKNELVTYLAHDIRTPMTSVMGYLELISETDGLSAERQQEYATRALAKANRLNGLVEELFEITRYNMQNIPIEREELDIELLCQQIVEEFFPQAQENDLHIEVEVDEGFTAFLDPSRMGRVLENILKNAIAHAAPGSTVVIGAHADETSERPVMITVCNEGKEISSVHLEHIFDRFYRVDAARGQNTGGAGLGLAIAKEIVEAHGGIIAASSERGVTTFTIQLP